MGLNRRFRQCRPAPQAARGPRLRHGVKTWLEGADVARNPGDKIGLTGASGPGKSSLFALLRGELQADKGEAEYPPTWRVAHDAQETPALERPALEYAIDGDTT